MELLLKSKQQERIKFTDKNFVLCLNKLTFLSGDVRESQIMVFTDAYTIDHPNRGGTHGFSFSLPFIVPFKIDLLKNYEPYNHISVW
jgi:hypothetical protein